MARNASWDRKWTPSLEWQPYLCLLLIRECCHYLVLSSNIRAKGDKMKRKNNPIRLPFEIWCSLAVPQCAASNKGNWSSWWLYTLIKFNRSIDFNTVIFLVNRFKVKRKKQSLMTHCFWLLHGHCACGLNALIMHVQTGCIDGSRCLVCMCIAS